MIITWKLKDKIIPIDIFEISEEDISNFPPVSFTHHVLGTPTYIFDRNDILIIFGISEEQVTLGWYNDLTLNLFTISQEKLVNNFVKKWDEWNLGNNSFMDIERNENSNFICIYDEYQDPIFDATVKCKDKKELEEKTIETLEKLKKDHKL